MAKLTIEQAEKSPTHLSYRKHIKKDYDSTCNTIEHGWEHWNRSCISMRWIHGFVNKFVDRKYDECYSEFLKKLSEERIYRNGYWRNSALSNFDWEFDHRGYPGSFYVNAKGIIKKYKDTPKPKRVQYQTITYRLQYCARLSFMKCYGKKFDYILDKEITQIELGKLMGNDRAATSFVKDMYARGFGKQYYYYWPFECKFKQFFTEIKKDPIILTKEERRREMFEQIKYRAKLEREAEIAKQEQHEADLRHYGSLVKSKQKAARFFNKEEAKRAELENIVTRDRLGFDETSFKTSQKFSK